MCVCVLRCSPFFQLFIDTPAKDEVCFFCDVYHICMHEYMIMFIICIRYNVMYHNVSINIYRISHCWREVAKTVSVFLSGCSSKGCCDACPVMRPCMFHDVSNRYSVQLWPFLSYNLLFQWDCTFHKWGDLVLIIGKESQLYWIAERDQFGFVWE